MCLRKNLDSYALQLLIPAPDHRLRLNFELSGLPSTTLGLILVLLGIKLRSLESSGVAETLYNEFEDCKLLVAGRFMERNGIPIVLVLRLEAARLPNEILAVFCSCVVAWS